jgi:hypothetical protein
MLSLLVDSIGLISLIQKEFETFLDCLLHAPRWIIHFLMNEANTSNWIEFFQVHGADSDWNFKYLDWEEKMVCHNGMLLKYTSQSASNDRDLVHKAIQNSGGMALKYASAELRKDESLVLCAVEINGMALEHADMSLRKNTEICLHAVRSHGLALQFFVMPVFCR